MSRRGVYVCLCSAATASGLFEALKCCWVVIG